jgi:hypothetical protein
LPNYDASGRRRITLLDGVTIFRGLYAPDGSFYAQESPGTGFVGIYAPDGSIYVTFREAGDRGFFAPDGSVYIGGTEDNYFISVDDTQTGTPPDGGDPPGGEEFVTTFLSMGQY